MPELSSGRADEQAGQLYAYRVSQNSVILKTRESTNGTTRVAVGIQPVAAGMYTCVALNGPERNESTVSIDPKG